MRRRISDLHAGIVLLALCGVMLLVIPSQVHAPTVKIVGWGEGTLSPSFFPYFVVSALAVASALLIATRRHRPDPLAVNALPRAAVVRLAALVAMWAAYVAALPWLGYLVGTALLLVAMMRFLGYRRWGVMAAVAAAVPLVTFWAFEGLLKVFLPRGALFP